MFDWLFEDLDKPALWIRIDTGNNEHKLLQENKKLRQLLERKQVNVIEGDVKLIE